MSSRRVVGWIVALAALAVMVIGLLPEPRDVDPDIRQQQLAQRIACPWCHGQSLAESDSEVASDLVVILREKIDAGWEDDQIYDFFASRYGDHVLLDPSATRWGVALWSLPAAALIAGGWVVWSRQRVVA
jgi:cytochrome c-type biogenesis protein CcmH